MKAQLIRLVQMLAPILIKKWNERQAAKRRTR